MEIILLTERKLSTDAFLTFDSFCVCWLWANIQLNNSYQLSFLLTRITQTCTKFESKIDSRIEIMHDSLSLIDDVTVLMNIEHGSTPQRWNSFTDLATKWWLVDIICNWCDKTHTKSMLNLWIIHTDQLYDAFVYATIHSRITNGMFEIVASSSVAHMHLWLRDFQYSLDWLAIFHQ